MKTFKLFLTENSNNAISRAGAITLVLRNRSLSTKLQNEIDFARKIDLLSQQNLLLSYLIALNLAHSLDDRELAQRFRSK